MDIDYRPYTWKSNNEASRIYNKAAENCDVIIGNDEEFGIMSMDYKKGLDLAKSLSKKSAIVIYKMGIKLNSLLPPR